MAQATMRTTTRPRTAPKQEVSIEDCLDQCTNAANACSQTLAYCLEQGGEYAEGEHISLLVDGAEICRTSSSFLARESEYHGAVCAAAAEVARACQEACEAFEDDETMRRCAEACRACHEACTQIAA